MMDLNRLKQLGTIKSYDAKTVIFEEGDTGDNMYIVLTGMVDIYIKGNEEHLIKVSEIPPGDFFGEMSLLEGEPRSATAVALKNTITLAINKNNFEEFISQHPTIAYKIMKGLSARIRLLNEDIKKHKSEAQGSKAMSAEEDIRSIISNEIDVSLYDLLYPRGHKSYDNIAPQIHSQYLFDKKTTCPVCNKEFNVDAIWASKLKLENIDDDFRQRNVDMDVIWYNIWVCPECYFAGYANEFEASFGSRGKVFLEKTAKIRERLDLRFSKPKSINEVFVSNYLALYANKYVVQSPLKKAKLWLQLSWLYNDVNDTEMYELASSNALEFYKQLLYECNTNLSIEQEQQYTLILAELYLKKNNSEKALLCYYDVIKNKGGNKLYYNTARDRIYYLKNEKK